MSGEDFKIQHSVKTRSGDMLNVRGASAEEFGKVLSYVRDNITDIAGLGDLIRAAEAAAGGLGATTVPTAPAVQAAPQQAPVNQASAPVCRHGQKKWVAAGISKAGKPYDGFWGCNGPRDDQCRRGE